MRESVFLTSPDLDSVKIAITVEERDEPGPEASPSYQARSNDRETYERSPLRWGELDGALFTKNSQVFEQTVFFRKGGLSLIVSATSPLRIDALREALEDILRNLSWKP